MACTTLITLYITRPLLKRTQRECLSLTIAMMRKITLQEDEWTQGCMSQDNKQIDAREYPHTTRFFPIYKHDIPLYTI
jgi:hypothetical protein